MLYSGSVCKDKHYTIQNYHSCALAALLQLQMHLGNAPGTSASWHDKSAWLLWFALCFVHCCILEAVSVSDSRAPRPWHLANGFLYTLPSTGITQIQQACMQICVLHDRPDSHNGPVPSIQGLNKSESAFLPAARRWSWCQAKGSATIASTVSRFTGYQALGQMTRSQGLCAPVCGQCLATLALKSRWLAKLLERGLAST